jgi:iron-sulfur cluster assembly accessory protein
MKTEYAMDIMENTNIEQISLTESAAQAVKDLLTKRNLQNENYALRVFVQGGGCSGFQYGMALDNRVLSNDMVMEQYGVKVLVDEMSVNYLKGATVDYVDELMGSGFKISNPNAVASCGCGHSFRTSEQEGSEGEGCGCH